MQWQAREKWWTEHRSADDEFGVLLGAGVESVDTAWSALAVRHRTDGEAFLVGGAVIERSADGLLIRSAGEDALDSLEFVVGEVLGLLGPEARVLDERARFADEA